MEFRSPSIVTKGRKPRGRRHGLGLVLLWPWAAFAQGMRPGTDPALPPLPPMPAAAGAGAWADRHAPSLPPALDAPAQSAREPKLVVNGPTAEINVPVGRSQILDTVDVYPQILIANPAIADVQLLDREAPQFLNIYGLRFGTTTLTLLDLNPEAARGAPNRAPGEPAGPPKVRQYLIRVTIDSRELETRIGKLFPGAQVKVEQSGSQVILDGQVPDAKTVSEILQLVESELVGVQDAAQAGLAGGRAASPLPVAGNDPGAMAAAGQGPPQPGAGGPSAFSSGPAGGGPGQGPGGGGGSQGGTVRGGGGGIASGTIINRIHVPGPRQILLRVKIAELNRTALREIGVNFDRISGGTVVRSLIGGVGPVGLRDTVGQNAQLIGLFDDRRFNLYIDALRQNNLAKILAEPNLVALDGQPARFQSGGSFPFPVPQANAGGGTAITIQFRDFGALLEFVPHLLGNDVIRLDIEPVFSQLDPASGVQVQGTFVPGIRERRARTVVELREGQTLAIAGLLQTVVDATSQRIPFLGDIPFFGQAFSRSTFRNQETELVVLVTPVLVAPSEANEVPPSPGDLVFDPNDFEFYLLGRLEGKTGRPFRSTVQYLDPFGIMKHYRNEDRWVMGPHGHAD